MKVGDRVKISKAFIKRACKMKKKGWTEHMKWLGDRAGTITGLSIEVQDLAFVMWEDDDTPSSIYSLDQLEVVQ